MTVALIIVFLLLLFFAANFSALETALFALRDKRVVRSETSDGTPLAAVLQDPAGLLPEVLLLGGVANLLLTALGLHGVLGPLRGLGWNVWLAALAVFGGAFLFVEIIPKTWALRVPEKTLRRTLPVLLVMQWLFAPVAERLMRLSDALITLMTPRKLKQRRGINAEEIETLIEMREEQGAISSDESIVLQQLVKLNTLTVKDCMTPRVDLPLMPHDSTDEEAVRMLEGARARFVPVFDEKADTITGLVDTEEWRLAQRPAWQRIAQTPVLVPETMSALDALHQHLERSASAVVIVDEYGGVEGLLTHGNIVECLLSKAAPALSAERSIQSLGEGRWLVSGAARIDEVNRELETEFEAEGVDTIGGLVFNAFGYMPKPGQRIEINGIAVKVKRMARNRVTHIELRLNGTNGGDHS